MSEDLQGRLRCTAGIAPDGQTTMLRPEARSLLNQAASEIDRLRGVLWSIGHPAGCETRDDLMKAARDGIHPNPSTR